MHMFINALILALLVPAPGPEKVEDGPACRAELKGLNLLTRLELPTGMVIEGPWRVVHTGTADEGRLQLVMFATLDRVVESDGVTGERSITHFPQPIRLAFEGESQAELVQRAARVWCVTVMRSQENRKLDTLSPQQVRASRVAMLETDQQGVS